MSSDLAVIDTAPVTTANLFGGATPEAVLVIAQEMAEPLANLIREKGMVTVIKDREHVNIEGWQTAGSMLGISAHTVWSRALDDDAGWEARAEARTRYGEVVGSAEAMCTRDERGNQWRRADQYAIRSMAQTRAQSKALASALRFVMTLAGASGSPAEEVPDVAVPAWQRPVPDLHELVSSCADVLGATLPHDPDLARERAKTLCQRIYNDCGQDVPMVVWQTFSLLLGAMMGGDTEAGISEAPEVETPVASSPIADAIDAEVGGGNAELDAKEHEVDEILEAQTFEDTDTTTTEEDPS